MDILERKEIIKDVFKGIGDLTEKEINDIALKFIDTTDEYQIRQTLEDLLRVCKPSKIVDSAVEALKIFKNKR